MSLHDAAFYEDPRVWDEYDIIDPRVRQMRLAAIDAILPLASELQTMLDVGAGNGLVVNHLASNRPSATIVALDRSFTALQHNQVPARVRASADFLPFPDRSFDLVMCCEVLEHLPRGLYDRVRHELARAAGRHVLISVPNNENRRRGQVRCQACDCAFNALRHLRSFTEADMEDLLPGFRLQRLDTAGPRTPVYPRFLRTALERRGLVERSSYPRCPLCDEVYDPGARGERSDRSVPQPAPLDHERLDADAVEERKSRYRFARNLTPKSRRRYWMVALYERNAS